MRSAALLFVLLLIAAPAGALPRDDAREAGRLYEEASRHFARHTIEGRRVAIADLEQATLLAPGNPEYELTLARVLFEAGFLKRARQRFERVVRMSPDDPDGRLGLGAVWRRDWLKYLDPTSLDRAVANVSAGARARPAAADAWLLLTPLLFEKQDLRGAAAAARRALEADPGRPEAMLAVAYTAYRMGEVARADSAFTVAVPRLRRSVRERFEDISPVATESDTAELHRLDAAGQAEFVRRFWKDSDPDLGTAENEARLEYWARVTQAYFLFYNPRRREWDERGEVYVRYGAPRRAEYNPIGVPLRIGIGAYGDFPVNVLRWDYPELGMRVTLQDRILNEFYLLPINMDRDPDPRPDPDSLARHPEMFATRAGRGVFPKLPPGATPLPVAGSVARFQSDSAARLIAQLEVPGGPADSLIAEWVVLDSARTEVARARRELAPSACDPLVLRVADFSSELPPGHYFAGLSVRDGRGGRGTMREEVVLEPVGAELALSDVVVSCGLPLIGGPPVRIEPNPAARVGADNPLTAYFEIYHLATDRAGHARFEYVYTVRSGERDPRIWIQRVIQPRPRIPALSASREEEQAGPLRRQFVSVPVQTLPPGRYRLEISVRDLIAGSEARAAVPFLKLPPAAPQN